MTLGIFVFEYIAWHYGTALTELFLVWKNFLWFGYNFFSIQLLSSTLFTPFHRIQEIQKRGLDMEAILTTLVANTISRLVGFILRIFVIILGLLFEFLMLTILIPIFLIWIFFPLFIVGLFVFGFSLLL